MKYILLTISLIALSLITSCKPENQKTATFKVYGNCEMCKQTMESGLTEAMGVYSKNWNPETKIMEVAFDSTKTDLNAIHAAIAATGYDTEKVAADDEVYSGLHECCQYERK